MLETQLEAASRLGGRVAVFANVDFVRAVRLHKDYGAVPGGSAGAGQAEGGRRAEDLQGAGARLSGARPASARWPSTIPGLDKLFDKAGALGMPVAIHTGDPKAFWKPPTPDNERYDELKAHPDWSFHGHQAQGLPSWEQLYTAFEHRVARHPEDHVHRRPLRQRARRPGSGGADARQVPEPVHRHRRPRARDRPPRRRARCGASSRSIRTAILFGTDTGIGGSQEEMMYGSNGADPPTRADEQRFFTRHLALLRDRRQAVRAPHPHPGPLENRRPGPARADPAQALLRQRRPRVALEAGAAHPDARPPRTCTP